MFLSNFRKHLSNIPGWRTNRKLVIIESDDWGSIRIRSKSDYLKMLNLGLNVDNSNFSKFDCLESNYDLERLFNLLTRFKDINGNSPVITPMCVVANPDFEKISESNFSKYFYETFDLTCNRYPNHDKVLTLWKEGYKNKLFIPEFHGREHLNALRWVRALSNNDQGLRIAFDHESIGVSKFKGNRVADHLAAFDPQFLEDIDYFRDVLISGSKIFNNLLGYAPRHFVASNKPEPKILEETLHKIGIKYLIRYKLHKYPNSDGTFSHELNWLGRKNSQGQFILTRNCGFEPSDSGVRDWKEVCIKNIKSAFLLNKPAVISTHRVNYVSGIDLKNADSGLLEFEQLLRTILRLWPDVEFMSSFELGETIKKNK
jgi:hypothetical protein